MPVDFIAKNHFGGLAGPCFEPPPPSLAQHSVASVDRFRSATSGLNGQHVQQTPVPVPHPPQAISDAQVSLRPIQCQQQQAGYASKASMHSQPISSYNHNHSVTNHGAVQYDQQHAHTRTQMNSNSTSATNIYNPPRPPEVYTLPESVNDTLYNSIRQTFQQDVAGRVVFFAGPPLDRPVKRVSPRNLAVEHSVKYLAGRARWLVDREKKRRWRRKLQSTSPGLESRDIRSVKNASAARATSAIKKWVQAFGDGAAEWRQEAQLDGWMVPASD